MLTAWVRPVQVRDKLYVVEADPLSGQASRRAALIHKSRTGQGRRSSLDAWTDHIAGEPSVAAAAAATALAPPPTRHKSAGYFRHRNALPL